MDEKEKGIRNLNFGHTFGHAIESFTGFSKKFSWRSGYFRHVSGFEIF